MNGKAFLDTNLLVYSISTDADKAAWGADGSKNPYAPPEPPPDVKPAKVDASDMADAGADAESDNMDDLFKEMMGQGADDAGAPDAASDAEPSAPKDDMDDLFNEMMGTDKKK